jgi:hypothetical protein
VYLWLLRRLMPGHVRTCLTREDVLQWREAVIGCVLERMCEGHTVTCDELIELISPDDNLAADARRFMWSG